MDVVLTQDFFPRIGGAHLWLYETYRRWPSQVKLLTRKCAHSVEEVAEERLFDERAHGALDIIRRDIGIEEINLLSRHSRKRFCNVTGEIATLAIDDAATIHCLRAFPEGISGLLCKLRRPRETCLITYAHGEEILIARSSRQLTILASLVYKCSDLVIANSRSTERMVRGLCSTAKVACIHPGVDIARFRRRKSDVAEYRRAWGWSCDTIVVSTVARMEPRKNQAMVIRAIADLNNEGLSLAYVCGGDGQEKDELIRLAGDLGLGERVRFTGKLTEEDKILTYAASDIFAMPSIQVGALIEGFGIVFLEAAAAGLPSVCGNVGGQAEAVLEGRTGLVVDGVKLEEVKDALRLLATDASLRGRMGHEGREWAARHDWSNVAAETFSTLRSRVGREVI
jgi:phosphatidyl-myo-inositol dimannoside synthase